MHWRSRTCRWRADRENAWRELPGPWSNFPWGFRASSLATVGRDVIHELTKRRYPDFRMLSQVFQQLAMRVGGYRQIVAADAVELEYPKAPGLRHAFDIGREPLAVGTIQRSPAWHHETTWSLEAGD